MVIRMIRTLSLLLALAAAPAAQAACYADYKAKQDDPLRLAYGVAEITGPCDAASAVAELTPRLAGKGWTLLDVMGTFGDDGLEERKARAGDHYLSF